MIQKTKSKQNLDLNPTPYTELTQNIKLQHSRKSSESTTWQTVLRHDTKCVVHKGKMASLVAQRKNPPAALETLV